MVSQCDSVELPVYMYVHRKELYQLHLIFACELTKVFNILL